MLKLITLLCVSSGYGVRGWTRTNNLVLNRQIIKIAVREICISCGLMYVLYQLSYPDMWCGRNESNVRHLVPMLERKLLSVSCQTPYSNTNASTNWATPAYSIGGILEALESNQESTYFKKLVSKVAVRATHPMHFKTVTRRFHVTRRASTFKVGYLYITLNHCCICAFPLILCCYLFTLWIIPQVFEFVKRFFEFSFESTPTVNRTQITGLEDPGSFR